MRNVMFQKDVEGLLPTSHRALVLYVVAALLLRWGFEGLSDAVVRHVVRTERHKTLPRVSVNA